jgi:hypothetical protein
LIDANRQRTRTVAETLFGKNGKLCTIPVDKMKSLELLVLPRKLGWGWRLNWRHRLAWPFLLLQIAFIAGPIFLLRYSGVESNEAYGGCALATIAISACVWFVLARKEV